MSLQGHAAVKFVTGRQLASASGRGWTNMLAERWRHAVGELPSVLPRDTEIAVLLSGSTLVEGQGPGLPQSTLGRRGSVWVCPSGIREDFINIRQPVDDCLHIFLPAKPFADCMLQDLEIDPARVTLRYEAVGYDPFIAQIALAISRELSAETSAGRLLMESLSQSLSAYLVHHYSEIALRSKPLGYSGNPMDGPLLLRVMEFIDAHIEQNFTVADLAAVRYMRPAHFARSLKETRRRPQPHSMAHIRLALQTRMSAALYRSMSD